MAEITNTYGDRAIENYAISSARKSIYKKSNEPLDGYKKVELQSGGVTYHKDVRGVQGYITYLNMADGEYGTSMTIMLDAKDGSDTSALRIRLGGSEFGQIINKLYNTDFSKQIAIEVYPRKSKKEGSDEVKEYLGVSVRYPNETQTIDGKEVPASPEWLSFEDAPKPQQKRGKWDFSEQEDYYYEKANELIDRYLEWREDNPYTAPEAPQDTEEKEEPKTSNNRRSSSRTETGKRTPAATAPQDDFEEEDDDLPF